MAGLQQLWSTTANNNQTADSAVNQREGMAPSQVNDAARQIMARIKAFALDTSGMLVTTGTGTGYNVETNEVITSLTDGLTVAFRAHVANTGAATLAVDGTGGKPFRKGLGVALVAGDIQLDRIYRATYRAASDEFILHQAPATNGVLDAPFGTRMLFNQTAAPAGWTKEVDAFYNDTALRTITGTVANGAGSAFSSVFTARSIVLANLPTGTIGVTDAQGAHAHVLFGPINVAGNNPSIQRTGAGDVDYIIIGTNLAHNAFVSDAAGSHGHNVTSLGSGVALDFATKFVDLIIAQKA